MSITEFLATLPPSMDCHGGYDDTKLTKLIRGELALAVAQGALPVGSKWSVRKDHYRSLHIDLAEWSGAVFTNHYLEHAMDPTTRDKQYDPPPTWEEPTPTVDGVRYGSGRGRGWRYGDNRCVDALNQAVADASRIADRHNYDNSRIEFDHFDVGYYLHVGAAPVISTALTGIKLESDPEYAALLRKAHEAGNALGKEVVRSICGRNGIDGCWKGSLESLVKLAERAKGRPVSYDKRRRSWVVDDSDKPATVPAVRFQLIVSVAQPNGIGFGSQPGAPVYSEILRTTDVEEAKARAMSEHRLTGRHTRVAVAVRAYDTADYGERPPGYRPVSRTARIARGLPASPGCARLAPLTNTKVCVACAREASYPEQTGHTCGRTDRVQGGDVTERTRRKPAPIVFLCGAKGCPGTHPMHDEVCTVRDRASEYRAKDEDYASKPKSGTYFRCFLRNRNLGDTPYVVRDDGKAAPCDGSYGLIDALGNEAAIVVEGQILTAISKGKRGGTVRNGLAEAINWTVVSA